MIRKRVTFLRWLAWTAIHAAASLFVCGVGEILVFDGFPKFLGIVSVIGVMSLLGSPIFGVMWTYMYVEWFNTLVPAHHCVTCGYDLTGNISGACPECGETLIVSPRPDPLQ